MNRHQISVHIKPNTNKSLPSLAEGVASLKPYPVCSPLAFFFPPVPRYNKKNPPHSVKLLRERNFHKDLCPNEFLVQILVSCSAFINLAFILCLDSPSMETSCQASRAWWNKTNYPPSIQAASLISGNFIFSSLLIYSI